MLARRSAAFPLQVLLTYRSDEAHPSLRLFLAQLDRERLAQELTLAPLTRGEVRVMLAAMVAQRRSVVATTSLTRGDLMGTLYSLTEGNPFLIEELLTALIAAGDVVYERGYWQRRERGPWHIPRSAQDAIELRTAQLSDGARRILNLAALVGRHFDFALLQASTQNDGAELVRLIKELIAVHLVVEESAERFAFRHALTRHAIYTHLLVRERVALHRTIAETMERLYPAKLEAHLAHLASR